ncbi:MAG: hypothetical protein MZU84_07200 [Sphingobacterium sp.]|nr:hypothetical protein [Sphingobacterium sp.]
MQQDVIMAQTEKYMLLEKEEMTQQKIQSLEAMLSAAIGQAQRTLRCPDLSEPVYQPLLLEINAALDLAMQNSPELKSRNKMIEAANTKLAMARERILPGFCLEWRLLQPDGRVSLICGAPRQPINIPSIFSIKTKTSCHGSKGQYSSGRAVNWKQRRLMIEAALRDNYSMLRSSERLMDLYQKWAPS